MTKDEIIRMAREAGFAVDAYPDASWLELMGRFAALVAAAEREACALTCEEVEKYPSLGARHCAQSIRAWGQQ